MPACVSTGHRQRSGKGQRRSALLVRRQLGLLLGVTLCGACIGLGSQVWAIVGRVSTDPASPHLDHSMRLQRDAAHLRAVIASRAAVPSRSLITNASFESMTDAYEPSIERPTLDPREAIGEPRGLIQAHNSFARLSIGGLSVPDGAVQTAWSAVDGLPEPDWDVQPMAETEGRIGKSAAVPTTRQGPASLWQGLVRDDLSQTAANDRLPGNGLTRRFVPASIIPMGLAPTSPLERSASAEAPEQDTESADRDPRRRQRTILHVAKDGVSLDAEACRTLDRLALRLRETLRPVELQPHATTMADVSFALERAWAVRAYLAKRGVPVERMRITPALQDDAADETAISRRVDLTYISG